MDHYVYSIEDPKYGKLSMVDKTGTDEWEVSFILFK